MICQAEWHWRCRRERTQWHSNELQLSIRSSEEEFRATTAGEVLLLRESREPEVDRAGAVTRAENRGSRGAARAGWQQRRPEVEVDENLILQTALTSPRGRRLVAEQVRAHARRRGRAEQHVKTESRALSPALAMLLPLSWFVTGFVHRQAFTLFDLWVKAVGREPRQHYLAILLWEFRFCAVSTILHKFKVCFLWGGHDTSPSPDII